MAQLAHGLPLLFIIILTGYLCGLVRVYGIRFGSSMILFVGIAAGWFGGVVPAWVSQLGIVLFIYAVGLLAGARFFSSLRRQAVAILTVGVCVIGTALAFGLVVARFSGWSQSFVSGILTGALTSTPGLAAASGLYDDPEMVIGYGIAYPFGVILVVLFVQLFPKWFRRFLVRHPGHSEGKAEVPPEFVDITYRVTNSQVTGIPLRDLGVQKMAKTVLSRLKRGERIFVPNADDELQLGDLVLAVGPDAEQAKICLLLGPSVEEDLSVEGPLSSIDVIISNPGVTGKLVRELHLPELYDSIISRVRRDDFHFTVSGSFVLELGDQIRLVGPSDVLVRLRTLFAPNQNRALETNPAVLFGGFLVGVLLGQVPLYLPGIGQFQLGMSGGPLLAGLLQAHFGRLGKISLRIPYPTKFLLREIGLAFFLAGIGSKAGITFHEKIQLISFSAVAVAVGMTILPLLSGAVVAVLFLRQPLLRVAGYLCGAMTSTPALGALIAAEDSEEPALAYAAIYPAALIMVIIAVHILHLLTG